MTDFASALADEIEEHDPARRLPWHDDWAGFARDCIEWPEGTGLTDYQGDTLSALVTNRKEAVRSLHGVGKSCTMALAVITFSCTREAAGIDWKAITTAGAWRQLERYLWPEIRLWVRRLRWDVLRRAGWKRGPFSEATELLDLSLKLHHGQAFAAASTDAALLEGAHAQELFFGFDESKSIAADVFDAAEGAFSTGIAFALAQSTPGAPTGRFYDIHQRKPGYEDWHVRHVTLAQAIEAGRINPEWAERRKRQWGEQSALYQNRVLGNFASTDEDSVIPLAWVEAANERWNSWKDSLTDGQTIADVAGPVTDVGVDIARGGGDKTVLALLHTDVVSELRPYPFTPDTMVPTGHLVAILRQNEGCRAVVDAIGLGGTVVDRAREVVREQEIEANVLAFSAQAGPESIPGPNMDRSHAYTFLNARSKAWWLLRERLCPDYGATLALPPDDELIGDLTAPHWWATSGGKIQIESKDDVRKRLGRSTDVGDTVVQAAIPHAGLRRRRKRMVRGGTIETMAAA